MWCDFTSAWLAIRCLWAQEEEDRGLRLPNVKNTESVSPNVFMISGVGSRDYSKFIEIWMVVRSETLFFLFEMIVEAARFLKFVCR